MAKRDIEKVSSRPDSTLPTQWTPAPLVGGSTTEEVPAIPVPEEMQGIEFEHLASGFPPSVKWLRPGTYCHGYYDGVQEDVGPNQSKLYKFLWKGVRYSVWGGVNLDALMDTAKLNEGDFVQIAYVDELPVEGRNPCRLFNLKIARKRE